MDQRQIGTSSNKKNINEWLNSVKIAVLKRNGEKLLENCQTMSDDGLKIHTKTRHNYEALSNEVYKAEPKKMIIEGNKQRTRTIFMSQNGMLECGKNMRGTIPEKCPQCDMLDDENHRLNYCPKWKNTNNGDIDFKDIYSSDGEKLDQIINEIENVWELKYANGRMKK